MPVKIKTYCMEQKGLFLRDIVLSESDRETIELDTKNQTSSQLWWVARKGRITASRIGKILKCTGNYLPYMQSTNYTCEAMEWVQNNECFTRWSTRAPSHHWDFTRMSQALWEGLLMVKFASKRS